VVAGNLLREPPLEPRGIEPEEPGILLEKAEEVPLIGEELKVVVLHGRQKAGFDARGFCRLLPTDSASLPGCA
jgi:hypothetical protein